MATGFLSPVGLILQAFSDQGVVGAGYKINTYLAGSTTPVPTYTDSTLTVANSNPIIMQSNGRLPFSVWAPAGTVLKMVLQDSLGNTIAGGTVDNLPLLNDVLSSLYPQTAAEIAAGVTISNYTYPAGNVKRYGAKGDGVTYDDVAITNAILQCNQTGGASVYFPKSTGDYRIQTTINVNGDLYMYGECDRLSVAGPRVTQSTNGIDSFTVFGTFNASITCERMTFAAGSATAPAGKALWNINPSAYGPNSFYWKNCWFQTPVFYALNLSGCDDIQVLGCTFDITGEHWIALGTGSAGGVTNASFIGNTFADNTNIGLMDVGQVDNLIFSGNRCYSNSANASYGINLQSAAVGPITNVVVSGNTFKGYNYAVLMGHNAVQTAITGNTIERCTGPALSFGGGTVVANATITGNVLSGYAGSGNGMIDGGSTPVQNVAIMGNTILANGVGGPLYTFSPVLVTGAVTGTFSPALPNGTYSFTFSDAEIKTVTVSGAGTTATWTGGLTGNNIATASASGTTGYAINLPNASVSNNKLGPNTFVGASSANYAVAAYVNNGVVDSGTFPYTSTGLAGAAGSLKYTVNGNQVSLYIPALGGAASGATAVTIVGLPAFIQPTSTQNESCIVTNNSVNVAGNVSITSSSTLTFTVGSAGGAFNGSGNNGVQAFAINYLLN
jgi:hypothetical protein